jgi:hypothetical protein
VSDLTTKEVKASIDSYFTNYFANTSDLITESDMAIITTALLSGDLTVRDYFMGMTEDYPDESLASVSGAIALLSTYLPDNHRKTLNTVLSSYAYRAGDEELANEYLKRAFDEDSEYQLAILLKRVYKAQWGGEAFITMAKEMHHKVVESLLEDEHLIYA